MARLWFECRHHRQQAFDQARACLTLRPNADVAPLYTRTAGSLRCMVGRLSAFALPECPSCLAPLHTLLARPRGVGPPTLAPCFPEAFHLAAQRAHSRAQRRTLQRALAHPRPPRHHRVPLRKQARTHLLRGPATAVAGCKGAPHLRPASLAPPPGRPVVGPVAVGHQEAGRRAPPTARAPRGHRGTAGADTPSPRSSLPPSPRPVWHLDASSSHLRAPPRALQRRRRRRPPRSGPAPTGCLAPHASAPRRYLPAPAQACAWTSETPRDTARPWRGRGARRAPWAPQPATALAWARRLAGPATDAMGMR